MCVILKDERQALWTVLRSSISKKLDYWLSLMYPSLMRKVAEEMDKVQNDIIENLVGMRLRGNWELPLNIPVEGLNGLTFQELVIRQPIRMGGLGIRQNVETSMAAFIGAIEQALPSFTSGERPICPGLKDILGDFTGNIQTMWEPLIKSGCRTGREFLQSWEVLRKEATQGTEYLGIELQHPLLADAEGAGEGSTDGSTRKKVVQQREEIRGAILAEALKREQDQKHRAVTAWENRDKLSTAWLLCLPGPDGLNNTAFAEALAISLCMPSPSCKERVGAKVGRRVVDSYGDNIMSEILPGDHWRIRHDKIKMTIYSLCIWSRLPATVEVWGLFSHLIPGQALTRMEAGRKRQAIVADLGLDTPINFDGT